MKPLPLIRRPSSNELDEAVGKPGRTVGLFWMKWIHPGLFRLIPTAGGAAPAAGVTLKNLLEDAGAVEPDVLDRIALELTRRHEPDGSQVLQAIVPVHECTRPGADHFLSPDGLSVVVRSVLAHAESRL